MFTTRPSAQALAALALVVTLLPAVTSGKAAASPDVAEPFAGYYDQHQGMRVLGYPLSESTQVQGYPAQYFEKGRIEDHRADVSDPRWAFMYGRLTVELMDSSPDTTVNGFNFPYRVLKDAANPDKRRTPPAGFVGGTMALENGRFVPFDPFLRAAPGYVIPSYFWAYINRPDLFPAGWLHDIGLPLTSAFMVDAMKGDVARDVMVQAFERAVLTYDKENPAAWQVEKGNIGVDAVRTAGILPPAPQANTIEIPAVGARVTVPLHILARVGQPGEQVTAVLRWQNGKQLAGTFTLLGGENGGGLLIGNLDWGPMPQPPEVATQSATLEIHSLPKGVLGPVLASRTVTVVNSNDPATQRITLFWTVSGNEDVVQPQWRNVIKSDRIAATALEELLWGPPAISQVGFRTAIPLPEEILRYLGRQPDWGPRVRLLGVKIEGGIATADFSKEMKAYGGGSLRVKLIRDQITQTLKQFPTVREVRIAIEGQTEGVLEP